MDRMATLLHAAVGLVVAVPVIALLTDPLRRRSRGSAAPFIRVTPLDALPPGRPVRLPVVAERSDSFIRHPATRTGEVWILREDPGGEHDAAGGNASTTGDAPGVRAWQATCPHLGCGINYAPERRQFACPCHTSAFALDGSRLYGPSPRDMDPLEVRISEEHGQVWVDVRYEKFRTGVAERVTT